jgi:hypothetical protein
MNPTSKTLFIILESGQRPPNQSLIENIVIRNGILLQSTALVISMILKPMSTESNHPSFGHAAIANKVMQLLRRVLQKSSDPHIFFLPYDGRSKGWF